MKNKVEFIERNLGNVNNASQSSREYTMNTHPSSQHASQASGAAEVVGLPPRNDHPLLNFAHE